MTPLEGNLRLARWQGTGGMATSRNVVHLENGISDRRPGLVGVGRYETLGRRLGRSDAFFDWAHAMK